MKLYFLYDEETDSCEHGANGRRIYKTRKNAERYLNNGIRLGWFRYDRLRVVGVELK